jgi:very-short-patch-repair endonuclease
MKRGGGTMARVHRAPRARQLEMHGLTADPVRVAYDRQQRKREASASWEDDFDYAVKSHLLPVITRKFLFAKQPLGRRWEADFAYPDLKLLIEIDGGVWRRGGGAHSHPSNIQRDMEKSNDAALLGYRQLRFTSDQVRNGEAVAFLIRVLAACGWVRS